jgi:pilus assembly protein FimV
VGKTSTFVAVAFALLLAVPFAAHSAGLGRLSVLSSLGQPLNAEIEIVSLQAGEEEGLAAKLASTDAFMQAGIELNPALIGIRFAVERRGGRAVLRLSTVQPVSEPFLEMLVELQWNTGRLVREYTFLLDPPEYRSRQAIAATPPAADKPAPEATPAAALSPAQEAKPAAPEAAPVPAPAPVPAQALAPAPSAAVPAAQRVAYEVKRGDTLGAIARQYLPPGVTLNQMLIAIFRANESAFIRGNINLVRSGRILNIPDADGLGTLGRAEANTLVRSHIEQWNEYRSRLAAVPVPAESTAGQRQVAGKIDAKPSAAPAPQPDQLRLSKADPKKPASAGDKAAREDDAASRERALKEAQSRQADLEKNIADMQKLTALKNQQMAELEKKAAAKPAAEAPKPAPVAPAPAAKAPEKPAAEAPKPAAAPAPAPTAKAPEKPAAEAPKPKPKSPAEPGVLELFMENQLALGGLGLIILLLAGYGYWAWRRKKAAHAKFQDSVLGAAAVGSAGEAGLAEPAGGPGAAAPTSSQSSVSQQPGGMTAEEVDPIAEADVYMAYGRDAQAEEILKESLQKDPNRTVVLAKLLEIYANRKDGKSFEQMALKLKGITNGAGPEWDKAAALGRSIDPQNGLYAGAGGGAAAAAPAAAASGAAAPAIDFDLGGGGGQAGASAPDISLDEPAKEASSPSIDFDLGGTTTAITAPGKADSHDETVVTVDRQKPESAPASMDFNLDLGGTEKMAEAPAAPAAMDFSAISLDLGGAGDVTAALPQSSTDPKWQEVATKLDLAKAYEEMGDKDGARELLNEVMKDGDAAQKAQAQALLAKLG